MAEQVLLGGKGGEGEEKGVCIVWETAQTIYTNVSKCKNDQIKERKKPMKTCKNLYTYLYDITIYIHLQNDEYNSQYLFILIYVQQR
jgi:hypothetical protein